MEEFAEGKITRDKIAVVEEVLYAIMQQQILLNAQMHMEKLNILENSIDKMSVELENMDVRDKTIRQNSRLDNKSDIGENKAKEIVCDKQFLTHLALSQVSVNKELTFNLIEEAMNNKNADLVLAGLTSLANDQVPTAD
ncbi:MAG TPA: hypothetical protein LFW14_00040 [Rickettsia endosymbiont of Degeeriella rufa]|nr:hypothetical protein [Rickettsia endosymbiont of Degeeriella rufa]